MFIISKTIGAMALIRSSLGPASHVVQPRFEAPPRITLSFSCGEQRFRRASMRSMVLVTERTIGDRIGHSGSEVLTYSESVKDRRSSSFLLSNRG